MDTALQLCQMALSAKRNEAQLYLNLAEVYKSCGRREEALVTLDRAAASLGRDARILRARMKLGRRRSPVLTFSIVTISEQTIGGLAAPPIGMGRRLALPSPSFLLIAHCRGAADAAKRVDQYSQFSS